MASDVSELRSRGKLSRDSIHSPTRSTTTDDYDDRFQSTVPFNRNDERIGYRHWLLIVALVAIVYSSIVYLDNRMPEVVNDVQQFVQFSETRARRSLDTFVMHGPRPSGSDACEVSDGGGVHLSPRIPK
jgi:hypothetical protein